MDARINENCIGCGFCVSVCPDVFVMTDEDVAKAQGNVPEKLESEVMEAAEGCPVDAIEVEF